MVRNHEYPIVKLRKPFATRTTAQEHPTISDRTDPMGPPNHIDDIIFFRESRRAQSPSDNNNDDLSVVREMRERSGWASPWYVKLFVRD